MIINKTIELKGKKYHLRIYVYTNRFDWVCFNRTTIYEELEIQIYLNKNIEQIKKDHEKT